MTPFTDEDLKRLKELLDDPQASGFFTEDTARNLLARLEAAEWVVEKHAPKGCLCYDEWRKAAGK